MLIKIDAKSKTFLVFIWYKYSYSQQPVSLAKHKYLRQGELNSYLASSLQGNKILFPLLIIKKIHRYFFYVIILFGLYCIIFRIVYYKLRGDLNLVRANLADEIPHKTVSLPVYYSFIIHSSCSEPRW